MKRLKWIVVSVIGLIVLVVVVVLLKLDGVVRYTIESQSSTSLGLATQLRSAHVSLLGGSLQLHDFEVSSPKGFSANRMFQLGGAKVGVTVGKLRSDPIGVDQIVIDKPKLVVEQLGGKLNFQALTELGSSKSSDSSNGEQIKLIIHELAVNGAQVVIRPGIPGLQQELTIPIPSFVLKDIGTGEGNKDGAAIKEVVILLVSTLAKEASQSDLVPKEARALLSMNADQIKAQIQGEIDKQIDKAKDDIGKSIERGIGDALGGKSKDSKKGK